ncbi:MAG: MFS transporter [Candidatus Thermoplasmatota archaeon]
MLFKFSSYGFLKNLRFFEPFLYLFFLANGLSFFQIGILISIREVSTFLLEIPTGVIADLTGRRRAMASAFASYIFSFIIFYSFKDFYVFVPAMLLFALGETFRSGTHKSMIMEYLDEEDLEDKKVEYYGKTRSASRLGSALSAVLAGVIVYFWQSYNIVFLFTLIPYTFGFILMFTYPRRLDGKYLKRSSWKEITTHVSNSFKQLKRHSGLGRMILNASIYDSFFKISKDYLSPIVETFAIGLPFLLFVGNISQRTAILVGIVYFFVYLNSFVSSRESVSLMEKIGDMKTALNVLYFILAAAFLFVALFLEVGIVLLSIVSFFFFFTLYNLRKPMVVGYLGDRIEPETRATLLSGHNQMRSVVGIVIAPVLGYFADSFGLTYTFAFAGVILMITGILLFIKDGD